MNRADVRGAATGEVNTRKKHERVPRILVGDRERVDGERSSVRRDLAGRFQCGEPTGSAGNLQPGQAVRRSRRLHERVKLARELERCLLNQEFEPACRARGRKMQEELTVRGALDLPVRPPETKEKEVLPGLQRNGIVFQFAARGTRVDSAQRRKTRNQEGQLSF